MRLGDGVGFISKPPKSRRRRLLTLDEVRELLTWVRDRSKPVDWGGSVGLYDLGLDESGDGSVTQYSTPASDIDIDQLAEAFINWKEEGG